MATSPLLSLVIGSILLTFVHSSPLSKSDLETALEIFGPDENGVFGSLEDTLQSVRALQILKQGKAQSPVTCQNLKTSVDSSFSLDEASAAIKIASILNCAEGPELAKIVKPILLSSLENNLKLIPFYLSSTALASMAVKGWIDESDNIQNEFKYVYSALQKLIQSDGSWKHSLDQKKSFLFASGPGFETIAALIKLKAFDSSKLDEVKALVVKVFKKIVSKNGVVYFPGDDSLNVPKIESTSAILRGTLSLLSEIGEINLPVNKLFSAIDFVLSHGIKSSSVGASFDVIDIAGLATENAYLNPLFITLPSTYSLSSSQQLAVEVSDALGNTPDTLAEILSVSAIGKSESSLSNLELTLNSKSSFISSLPIDKLSVGLHSLKITASSKDGKFSTGGPISKKIKLIDTVTVTNTKLSIFDSDNQTPETETLLKFGNSKTVSLSATHLQKLTFSFQLSLKSAQTYTPQQVFVFLINENGIENIFIMKQSGNKFSINFVFLELMQQFYYASGEYTIKLFVGDSNIENSFTWTLGSIDLTFPTPPENAPKPPAKPVADLSSRFGPKQEIQHIFRSPEKRPLAQVSYAFSVLSAFPLLFFIGGLFYLEVNFKGFPSPSLPKLSAIAFHFGIFAILLLFAFFWIQLNLFLTLKLFLVLGAVTTLPGYLALSYLADSSFKVKSA